MQRGGVSIVGILNVTPDSFSDGGNLLTTEDAVDSALRMIDEGADIIEVGGDSTRPGSMCVGSEAEWGRIEGVLSRLSKRVVISVDTHNAEVARRSLSAGVSIINDISGVICSEMTNLIKEFNGVYIFMFNPHPGAHIFTGGILKSEGLGAIHKRFAEAICAFDAAGLRPDQVILDTGIGGFLSSDASVSWTLIRQYADFGCYDRALMFGCSRKGFLRSPTDTSPKDRDGVSALCGALAARQIHKKDRHKVPHNVQLYLRVHNVSLQRQLLQELHGGN